MRARALARRADEQFRPEWKAAGWLTVLIIGAILLSAGCRRGVPIVDTAPRPAEADGTISGTVRGPEGTSAIEGRTVEVVNLDTNERQRVTTNNAGGFTFKVKPGKYRVELTLRDGETIVKQPGVMNVNRSDVDAHADFVIGSGPSAGAGAEADRGRVSRPRGPAYRTDHGLGSPIA